MIEQRDKDFQVSKNYPFFFCFLLKRNYSSAVYIPKKEEYVKRLISLVPQAVLVPIQTLSF